MRQPLDDFGTPALFGLPRQDVTPDVSVQQHQLTVHRQRGALLGGVNSAFEIGQPIGVALGGFAFIGALSGAVAGAFMGLISIRWSVCHVRRSLAQIATLPSRTAGSKPELEQRVAGYPVSLRS
jgi:hypothetical protein